ncbi:MAG: DNA mismatch repair protein MutS, partial [uncultured Chloroflexia bacterium]
AHRLLQRGHRVVIVEQDDELSPGDRPGKKVITRSVARVLTPGTIIDLDLLDGRTNNYLAAIVVEGETYGLAYCDVSTGEFVATEFGGEHAVTRLEGELMRLLPAEVLISQDSLLPLVQPVQPAPIESVTDDPQWTKGHVTVWPSWRWDLATATEQLLRQFDVVTLDGYGLGTQPLATRAAGAVLQYLHETQRSAVPQIERIEVVSQATTMVLDQQTQRNL